MATPDDLVALLRRRRESRELDYKEDLDPSSRQDLAGLAKDVAALANTRGGTIIIGVQDRTFVPTGLRQARLAQFVPEDLDNRLGELIEPRVEFDVIPFDTRGKHFVAIRVEEAEAGPCVMKQPGNFPGPVRGQTSNAFARGAVFVRHGAKSTPATHRDFERMIRERLEAQRRTWFRDIRRISKAPPGSEIIVAPGSRGVRVTTDPSAPAVRMVLDTSKATSLGEELTTSVKLWNSDNSARLTEHQLYRLYAARHGLTIDSERGEYLLRSSLASQMPACYWGTMTDVATVRKTLQAEVSAQRYPSDYEALKLVFLIGGGLAKGLFSAFSCAHVNCRSMAARLAPRLGHSLAERQRFLLGAYGTNVAFTMGGRSHKLSTAEIPSSEARVEALLTELANELAQTRILENKAGLKRLDIGLYGHRLKAALK